MFKMRSEILVLKNTIFWYKIQIFGCQNTNFCFSKLAGLILLCGLSPNFEGNWPESLPHFDPCISAFHAEKKMLKQGPSVKHVM